MMDWTRTEPTAPGRYLFRGVFVLWGKEIDATHLVYVHRDPPPTRKLWYQCCDVWATSYDFDYGWWAKLDGDPHPTTNPNKPSWTYHWHSLQED